MQLKIIQNFLLLILLSLIFIFLNSCGDDKSKLKRNTLPNENRSKVEPQEGLLPLSKITLETPPDERETICKDYEGLLKATCLYEIDSIKGILKYFPPEETVNKQNKFGWTPLMWACKNGQIDLVKLFIAHEEVNPNLQDSVGRTALTYALSEKNREEIIQLLLTHSEIQVSLEDKWKDTPLRLAYQNNLFEVARALLKKGAKVNDQYLLVKAVQDSRLEFLELFLEYKAMPNALDSEGATALCEAAKLGNIVLLTTLLKYKADVNLFDVKNGSTPLILAAKKGYYEIVATLLQQGANPNLREKNTGKSCLWYAVSLNFAEVAELIRSYGGQF